MRIAPRELTARDGRAFVVRDARAREAGAILDLSLLVHATTPEFTVRDPDEFGPTADDVHATLRRLQAEPNSLSLVAAAGDDGVIGILSLRGARERKFRHDAELGVHVHGDWRGIGVGTALLEAALDAARASPLLRRVTLRVFAPNETARRLYAKCGFVEEGRLRGHVRIGDAYVDEIRMAIVVASRP